MYRWRGEDYCRTLLTEMDFLDEDRRAREHVLEQWNASLGLAQEAESEAVQQQQQQLGRLRYNPLISPVPVRAQERTPEDGLGGGGEPLGAWRWCGADEFHGCRIRVLAAGLSVTEATTDKDGGEAKGTDILQVRDASLFIADGAGRWPEIQEREEALLKERRRREAEARAAEEGPASPQTEATPSPEEKASPPPLPFFAAAEFKYATYMPKRNLLGDLDGLTPMELEEPLGRVGTGEVFDGKKGRWKESKGIDFASQRRGTFFGTLSREKASEPDRQIRRIAETVAMIGSREKLEKAKKALEDVVTRGKTEEEEIEMLKGELKVLRKKVEKAGVVHEELLGKGANDRARKFKVKWSYW